MLCYAAMLQDDSLLSSNWVSISLCVLYLLIFWACTYSTLLIKDQAKPCGRRLEYRSLPECFYPQEAFRGRGPTPHLAPPKSSSELSLLPSVEPFHCFESLLLLLLTLMWRVKRRDEEQGILGVGNIWASAAKQGLLGRWLVLAPTTFPYRGPFISV